MRNSGRKNNSCIISGQHLLKIIAVLSFILFAQLFVAAEEDYISKTDAGSVNWSAGYIDAVGFGVAPPNASKAQAKMLAKRAATADAQRNLLETIKGIYITSESRVKDFVTADDVIYSKVDGVIKGAVVIETIYKADGSAQVTMRIPMWKEKDSINEVFFKEVAKISQQFTEKTEVVQEPTPKKIEKTPIIDKEYTPLPTKSAKPSYTEIPISTKTPKISQSPTPTPTKTPKPIKTEPEKTPILKPEKTVPAQTPKKIPLIEQSPTPSPATSPTPKPEITKEPSPKTTTAPPPKETIKENETQKEVSTQVANATGIVIDASQIDVMPAMAPKIISQSGEEVYGPSVVNREKAITKGICSYVTSLRAAEKHERVKNQPQIFKCIEVKNKTDFVISNSDAAKIKNNINLQNQINNLKVVAVLK